MFILCINFLFLIRRVLGIVIYNGFSYISIFIFVIKIKINYCNINVELYRNT